MDSCYIYKVKYMAFFDDKNFALCIFGSICVKTGNLRYMYPVKMNTTELIYNSTDLSDYSSVLSIAWKEVSNIIKCGNIKCMDAERHRQEQQRDLIILTIILSLFGVVGTVGNILAIAVFSWKKLKSTSVYFMLLLAIVDLFVCVIVIPGLIVVWLWRCKFYIDAFCKILQLLHAASIPTSSMIMVAIACDRFFCIYLKGRIRINKLKSRLIICIIMVFGACLGIPPALAIGVYFNTGKKLVKTNYCMNNYLMMSYPVLLHYWNFITAIFFGMIIVIFIMYTLIFTAVYRHEKMWKNLHGNKVSPASFISQTKSKMATNECETSFAKFSNALKTSVEKTTICSKDKSQIYLEEFSSINRKESLNTKLESTNNDQDIPTVVQNKPQKPISERSTFGKIEEQCYQGNTPSLSNMNKRLSNNGEIHTVTNGKLQEKTKSRTMSKKKANSNTIGRNSIQWKTTIVLLTVTIVYVISFLPTFLMSFGLVPQNAIIYYMYFFNNAANPIIYCFMNKNFRADVKNLFCKCNKW